MKFTAGHSVRRYNRTDSNMPQNLLVGPVLKITAVEDQIGQYGHIVQVGGIIRLSDGTVEVPGNIGRVEVADVVDADNIFTPPAARDMRTQIIDAIKKQSRPL